ncbi:MAG TPA: tetratricopeptide repeat protein [Terriglobia bacterium]|nr:tetratricopeptide repeat protein [Terriglobia bacterium]
MSWVIFIAISTAPLYAQPEDLTSKVHRGKDLMAAGRFEEAIPIYRDVVQALPNNSGPVLNLGLALHMAGHEQEAVTQFQSVLKLDPGNLPARLFLGAAYLRLKASAEAVEPLRTVVRAQPDNREARLYLGQALLSLDRFQEASEQFGRLSELDPKNPKVWNGLGLSYEGLAGRNFEGLEKVAPESAYSLVLLADDHLAADQYRSAFFFYRESLAKMPEMRGVHAMLSEIYRRDGHADWAAKEVEKERKLPPLHCDGAGGVWNASSVLSRGNRNGSPQELECNFWAGRYQEVAALSKDSKTAEAYFWRTRAYSELARQAFSRLAQLPPSAEVHEMMAQMQFNRKNYDEATKEWQEALKLAPGNPYYLQGLAISLSCNGKYEGARQLLEDLIKQSPDSAELNYWLGFTLFSLEKVEAAIPFLEKGVEEDPTVLPAQRDLARAYLQVGQIDKAIPHLKAALPIDEQGSLYWQLARAYGKSGQIELQKEMLERFQQIKNSVTAEKRKFEEQKEITPP